MFTVSKEEMARREAEWQKQNRRKPAGNQEEMEKPAVNTSPA